MRIFNAVQIVVLYSLYPFLVQWLYTADFYAVKAAFWVALLGYIASFGGMVYAVSCRLYKND